MTSDGRSVIGGFPIVARTESLHHSVGDQLFGLGRS
jgi:hypothetical protein